MLKALDCLEWVIIDEVHELVSNERGAHLSIGLERLQAASILPVIRIGLSATLGNLKEAARFISGDRKSTRLNSSHANISYAVFCLKKKNSNSTNSFS